MEAAIQIIKDQIPVTHDWVSYAMFTGIAFGLFLGVTVLIHAKIRRVPLHFFGWFVISASLISLDIFLCYTGLMKEVIYLNDSTEFLALLLGPLLYLFLSTALRGVSYQGFTYWMHFLLPMAYLLTQIGFFAESTAYKFNAYISGFFPDVSPIPVNPNSFHPIYAFAKSNLHELILISFTAYAFLAFRLVRGRTNTTSIKDPFFNKLAFSKSTIFYFLLVTIVLLVIFVSYENDQGDPVISLAFASFILFVTYLFASSSQIFLKTWQADKYASSGMVSDYHKIYSTVQDFISSTDHVYREDFSLKFLSEQLETPSNYISQAINAQAQKNFNDYINQFRIERACKYLKDEAFRHLNIEGIGNAVGFKSKSSFYGAFKKTLGMTPSQYMKSEQ